MPKIVNAVLKAKAKAWTDLRDQGQHHRSRDLDQGLTYLVSRRLKAKAGPPRPRPTP